jgi:hypothetical protein
MSKNASLGAYGIMYVVKNKRSQVIALLLKNGVVVPSNASDITIALAVTNLLKVSKSFYKDFSALLLSQDVVSGMASNMSGSYSNAGGVVDPPFDFSIFTGGATPTTTTETNTSNTSTPPKTTSSSTSWLNQGLGLLQTGYQGYLQLDDNKTKRVLADASVQISSDEVKKKEDTPPPTKLSTGAIVGISLLGVTVVGLIVYLIAKKK